MQTISKKIRFSTYSAILLTTIIASYAVADDLLLPSSQGPGVVISTKKQRVIAKDKGKNIDYKIDSAASRYLTRADNIRLIANGSGQKTQLFIILSREPSRPGATGQGYCGAGFEDYLLLVEILKRELVLRDQLLLQSCLKSISLFIDQGDDNPSNGLTRKKDGSLIYRLVNDDCDKERVLTISKSRFKIILTPSANQ
jgi:hypothetical protein